MRRRTQGGSVARALRFSTGLFNSGDGPWEVRGRTSGVNPETGNPTAPAIQRIYKRDGTFEEHNTNSNLEFHQGHGHWHTSIATYELFEVPAPDPSSPCPSGALNKKKLIEKSVGEKVGFCTADQGLFDWGRFYQARRDRWNDERCREDSENSDPAESAERFYTCGGSNCYSPTRPVIGLSVGWGDTYAWARLEQFVGFPENDHHQPKPGCYLLRATFDKKVDQSGIGKFEESNEDDNTSFAYFQVDPPSLDPKNSSKISIIRSGSGVGP